MSETKTAKRDGVMQTHPEFIAARCSWWDRLRCHLFGHKRSGRMVRNIIPPFCWRCGKVLP